MIIFLSWSNSIALHFPNLFSHLVDFATQLYNFPKADVNVQPGRWSFFLISYSLMHDVRILMSLLTLLNLFLNFYIFMAFYFQFVSLSIIMHILMFSINLIICLVFISFFPPTPCAFMVNILIEPPLLMSFNFPLSFNSLRFLLSSATLVAHVPFYSLLISFLLLFNMWFALFTLFLPLTSLPQTCVPSHSSRCILLGLLGLVFLPFIFPIRLQHAEFCMVCCVLLIFSIHMPSHGLSSSSSLLSFILH